MTSPFSLFDWILVIGFLCLSGVVGIIARKRISTLADFLVAGRKLRTVWGMATLASTEMGLVTIVYFSEEAYLNGFVAISAGFLAGLTMWIVGKTGLVIKHLRALNVMTVPEYFEGRFNANIRWLAGILTFLVGVLNMGIFLQVEGKFLIIIMGLPSSYLPLIMGVLLLVVLSYTILGGMYSVVITDVLQFVVITIGIFFTTYFSVNAAGGFSGMVDTVSEHYGSAGFNLMDAPRYGLLFLIWTGLYYLSGWSTWQPVAQRIFSMQDVSTARKLYRISSVLMLFRACFPMLWGIAALAVVGTTLSGSETSTALPEMLIRVLPAGLIGFITIGFLSASMSTYDSYLLAFSSIFVQDVMGRHISRPLSEKERMLYTKIGILVIGVFIYFWGIYYQFTETVFRYITLTGSLSFAGTLTVLVGGIYWKRTTTAGAYCAFIGSAIPPIICLTVPEIDSTYGGLLSFILAPVGLVAGSLVTVKR